MNEIRLSLEEIQQMKEYCVKTKRFELASKIREWEKEIVGKQKLRKKKVKPKPEWECKDKIADLKMYNAIISSKPIGKYIDLKFLRSSL